MLLNVIVIRPGEAIMAHELIHREQCLLVKELADKEKGYLYWSNHPRNHADNEVEAYLETLGVLEPWFEAHCGG